MFRSRRERPPVGPGRIRGSRAGRAVRLAPALLALGILLPLPACYTYAETSLDTLSPGLQARVRLDDDGFGRVLNQAVMNGVPPENMDMERKGVVGRIVGFEADNVTVELKGLGGSVYAAAIPSHSIREVALRRFDRRRTAIAVGVGAVMFSAILTGTVGGTTSDELPDQADLMVLRLFSVPLR